MSLAGRSFLTLKDYSRDEIMYLLEVAAAAKRHSAKGVRHRRFEGMTLALIFEKRSTRTRCAFETAFGEEGGHPVFLSPTDIHLGEKESIEDTARVLGRMFDCIQFRGFKQATAETLAEYSGKPVYNGLTDDFHPTQALADLLTLQEVTGSLAGNKIAFIGDGRNNVARSLLIGCAKTGVHMSIGAPSALFPSEDVVTDAQRCAQESGAHIEITTDSKRAVAGADAVYTDVWYSMGEEAQAAERTALLSPYRVDDSLMNATGIRSTIFLHCLPAMKGKEVTAELIDGPRSRAWDQAENRKHTIKALMLATLGLD